MKKVFTILMVVSVIGAMIGCSGEAKPEEGAATAGAATAGTTADAAK
jgi:hypothetical protein